MWDQCKIALDFFMENKIPYWEMESGDDLLSSKGDYCFYKTNEIYVAYLKNGGLSKLDLKSCVVTFQSQTEQSIGFLPRRNKGETTLLGLA